MANYVSNLTVQVGDNSSATYNIRELFPHVGTCSTAAATAAKEVTIGNFKLYTGAWVVVKFNNTNSAAVASLTLNVDGTGAKPIKYRNANLSSASQLIANRYTYFIYDGTNYQIVSDFNSDTYDRTSQQTRIYAGTIGVFNYSLCAMDNNQRMQSFTTTSGTGTAKTFNTSASFMYPAVIMYNSANSTYADGTAIANNVLYEQYPSVDLRYSCNVTSTAGFTQYKPVYLECTINSDGTFKLTTTGLTQTFTNGKYYILLGCMYNTSIYQLALFAQHPMFYYDGTHLNGIVYTAAEKTKLSGIANGATKVESSSNGKIKINGTDTTVYSHPTHTAASSGLYKITVDTSGHVSATTAVAKADITALGIPGNDTDTKVTQSATTTTNYRPILFGAKNSTDVSTLADTITDQAYTSTKMFAKPDTGILYASGFSTSGYTNGTGAQLAQYGLYLKSYKSASLPAGGDYSYSRYALRVYDGKSTDNSGMLLTIDGGGLTIVGGGESATALANLISDDQRDSNTSRTRLNVGGTLNTALTASNEQLILSSDNHIYFLTKCNTIADRKPVVLDTNSYFYPGTTKTGSIGTSSYMWNSVYATTIYENGTSLASKYAAIGHTHTTTIAADSGTNQLTLAASTKYKLTAGETNFIFTTPPNTTYSAGTGLSLSGTTFNHSNSVTARTNYNARYVKYDAQGHVTGASYWTATATGTDGEAGWIKIATIVHTKTYDNTPIMLFVSQRGNTITYRLHIVWKNANNTDPDLDKFYLVSDESTSAEAYIIKSATSTWDLYIKKIDSYEAVGMHLYVGKYFSDHMTWTWQNVQTAASAITGGTAATKMNYYNTKTSRTANTVLAAPNGSDGVAAFRKLVAADIPSLNYSKVTSSTTNGKIKIDGTDTTVYAHPSYTSKTSGLYKITVDTLGHVSATASVAKGDIPALDYLPLAGGTMTGDIEYPGPGGRKTIFGKSAFMYYVASSANWAGGLNYYSNDGSTGLGAFGAYGTANTLSYHYIGGTYNAPQIKIEPTGPNLIINSEDASTPMITLFRKGSNKADWRIINTSGNLKFQSDYTTAVGDWYDALTVEYNTGNITMKTNATFTFGKFASATANANRYVFFKEDNANRICVNDSFKYNPSTNVLTVGSITGTSSNVTGTVAIAHGGTGATTRLGALKALTNEGVGTNAQYFLTITQDWGKGGYSSVANVKTVLGLKSAAYTASTDYLSSSTNYAGSSSPGGPANSATRADYVNVVASNEIRFYNDNQLKANNHLWIGYSWAAGSHYTPSGGSDTSSMTAPNITEFVMGNCSAGGLASVHAKTFILGNGSSPTKSSKTTTITTAATTTDRTITLPDASGTVSLLTKGSTSYWGMIDGDGATSGWIRTTTNGLIAQTAVSLANGGNGALGTSSWAFKEAYIAKVHALKHYGWYGQKTNDTRQTTANLTCGGNGAMQLIIVSSSLTTGRPDADGYIMDFDWDNTGSYKAQLFIPNSAAYNSSLQWRGQTGSSDWSSAASAWRNVLDANNLEYMATHSTEFKRSFDLDVPMSPILRSTSFYNRANRFALIGAGKIVIQYSSNNGSTWTDMAWNTTDETTYNKSILFNDTINASVPIGPRDSSDRTTSMKTRIIVTVDDRDVMVDQFLFQLNSAYQKITVTLEASKVGSVDTFETLSSLTTGQWDYQCCINTKGIRFTTSSGNYAKLRITLGYSTIDSNHKTSVSTVLGIAAYSGIYWGSNLLVNNSYGKSDIALYDRPYAWMNDGTMLIPTQLKIFNGNYGTFIRSDGESTYFLLTNSGPAQTGSWNSLRPLYFSNSTGFVTMGNGASISSSAYGALSIKRTSANNAGIKFYNNGSTYLGSLAIDKVNGTFHRFKTDEATSYEIIDRSVVRNNTTVGTLGWTSSSADTVIPTVNTIAYWNGAYSGTSSNLAYCKKGEFGTIVTKSTTDYSKVSISRNLTSGTKVGTITIDGTATDLYCQTNTNTDTKVNVTLGTTTKAYLLGTTTTPTSTATGVTSIADTGVYLGTAAGSLIASSIYGSGAESQSTAPTGGYRIYDCRSVNVSPNDGDKAVNFYFHMADMPDTSLWWSVLHMRGWTGGYSAWEIAGPSDSKDQRTKPLYVRTSNTNTAWGSWRKIYDTSNPPTASEVGALASTTKYAGSSSAGGAATHVATEVGNSAGARPVFFAYLGDNTRVVYNTNFTYNPSTGTITANKFAGNITSDGLNAGIYDLLNVDDPTFNGAEWMLTSIPSSPGGTSEPSFRRVKTAKFADYVTSNSRDVLFNDSTNTSKSITLSNPPTDTQYLKLYFKSSGNMGQTTMDNSVYSIAEVPYMTDVNLGGILQVAQPSDNQGVLKFTVLAFTIKITNNTLTLTKASYPSRLDGSVVANDTHLSANIIKVVAYR